LEFEGLRAAGLECMKDLKKLEEFHFEMIRDKEQHTIAKEVAKIEWIYSWCAQNLPQLKKIYTNYDHEELIDYEDSDDELSDGVAPKFKGTSSLETLETMSFLPEANLPELKELIFIARIEDPHFFTKICSYSSLTSLQLFHIKVTGDLYRVLDLIGSQLSSLKVKMEIVYVDYFRIFYSCPNLVEVTLVIDAEQRSEFRERVDCSHVHHLEEVTFGYNEFCETWEMPAGLLSLIFQAPRIRMIDIYRFVLPREDCVWLRDVVEGRFQRLQAVSFAGLLLAPGCTVDDFALMVKFLVCGAPNLHYFQIVGGWDNETDADFDETWCGGHEHSAIKFLDLLPSMIRTWSVPPIVGDSKKVEFGGAKSRIRINRRYFEHN